MLIFNLLLTGLASTSFIFIPVYKEYQGVPHAILYKNTPAEESEVVCLSSRGMNPPPDRNMAAYLRHATFEYILVSLTDVCFERLKMAIFILGH